jgi:hypothetical protein
MCAMILKWFKNAKNLKSILRNPTPVRYKAFDF